MFLLREKISKYLKTKFGLEYKPETEMIITVGASEAVDVALTTLVSPGDEVLIPEPCFVSYGPCTQLCGGKAVFVPTSAENDFKLTVDQLEKYVTPKTRVLFISYPNNPTGAIMEKNDLEPIADFVIKHDLAVISDEIYGELTYGKNILVLHHYLE